MNALGGTNVSVRDGELSMAMCNPALLGTMTDMVLQLNYSYYLPGTMFGSALYGHNFGRSAIETHPEEPDKPNYFAVGVHYQVTPSPSPIPTGYKGEIVLTFDPSKGNGGMIAATECYSHIGLITEKSKDIHDWKYLKSDKWGTTQEPQWERMANLWQLKINNMFAYFGCPEDENITAIVMVFHNGKGDLIWL